MELKRNNDIVSLFLDGKIIESYKFDEEINFSELISYLLSLNLSEKVNFTNMLDEMTEAEEYLVRILNSIIDDFNKKVDELKKFKDKNKNDDNLEIVASGDDADFSDLE